MKIKKAEMEVINRHGRRDRSHDRIKLDGPIDLCVRTAEGGTVAELRRYVDDADRAEQLGQSSDDTHVLLDWFLVHSARVSFSGGVMLITGYMSGVKGHRRDGESPYGQDGHGNPHLDDAQPFARVRWTLT